MEATANIYDRTALVKIKGQPSPADLDALFADLQEFLIEYPIIVVSFQEGKPPSAFVDRMKTFKSKVKARCQALWASRHHPDADGEDRVAALLSLRSPEATRVADVLRLNTDALKIRKEKDELLLKRELILRKCLGKPSVETPSPDEVVALLDQEFRRELDGKRQLFSMLSKGLEGANPEKTPSATSQPNGPDLLTGIRKTIMQKLGTT